MKNKATYSQLQSAKRFLSPFFTRKPEFAVILGSGLGSAMSFMDIKRVIPYEKIPYFPKTTVKGHKGKLLAGSAFTKNVVVMQGRFHFYEGYEIEDISFPINVLKLLGVKTLIITAAAGAINKRYKPCDLVFIKDHINLTGSNPLRGKNILELGRRFPDLSEVYDKKLRKKYYLRAKKDKIECHEGVYVSTSGPSYETPSEIKAFRKMGADVAGMSVVAEAITAKHLGIKVVAVAYVSNMASGISKKKLLHDDVLEESKKCIGKISKTIASIIKWN